MPKLVNAALAVTTALVLVQCTPKPEAPPPAPAKPVSFAYDMALSFTPAAAEVLKRHNTKTVTIKALYYGNVSTKTAAMADPTDGTLHLNTDTLETDAVDHTVHMTGAGVDPVRLKYIVEQKPLVQLNIFSTAKGVNNHLIICTVFQDYVSVAQERPVIIQCDKA